MKTLLNFSVSLLNKTLVNNTIKTFTVFESNIWIIKRLTLRRSRSSCREGQIVGGGRYVVILRPLRAVRHDQRRDQRSQGDEHGEELRRLLRFRRKNRRFGRGLCRGWIWRHQNSRSVRSRRRWLVDDAEHGASPRRSRSSCDVTKGENLMRFPHGKIKAISIGSKIAVFGRDPSTIVFYDAGINKWREESREFLNGHCYTCCFKTPQK